MNIDLDRGVTQRKHSGGFFVSMYKDQPDVYYKEDGTVATRELAEEAGFPVADLYKERRRRELMAHHRDRINRLLAKEHANVEEILERELAETDAPVPAPPPSTEPTIEPTGPGPDAVEAEEEVVAAHTGGGRKKKS